MKQRRIVSVIKETADCTQLNWDVEIHGLPLLWLGGLLLVIVFVVVEFAQDLKVRHCFKVI